MLPSRLAFGHARLAAIEPDTSRARTMMIDAQLPFSNAGKHGTTTATTPVGSPPAVHDTLWLSSS
jgi:hypothetical protein